MKVRALIKEVLYEGDAYINAQLDGMPIQVKVVKRSLLRWLRAHKRANLPVKRDSSGRLIIG